MYTLMRDEARRIAAAPRERICSWSGRSGERDMRATLGIAIIATGTTTNRAVLSIAAKTASYLEKVGANLRGCRCDPFDFKRDIASSVSWKGGRFAHQRSHSTMDSADNGAVGCLNNAPVSHLAFILLSVGCSVFVAGSDIGPKVLDIVVGH
jgi:hypothetical protein